MNTYTLKIKNYRRAGFRYETFLYDDNGRLIDHSYFDTIWGCKRWGRRSAKRHSAARKTYTIEVKA